MDDDDAELVRRCRAGDASAWSAIVRRYERLILAIVRRAGLDEHMARDVFQTVFSRLVQHLPRLAEPSRLQAWIVTTAKREALRARSLLARSVPLASEDSDADGAVSVELVDEAPLAEEALSDLQQLHQLRAAFARLDERCRDLLELLFADDDERLGYAEIARRVAMPVGSLGPTRSRCLAKLRALFATPGRG